MKIFKIILILYTISFFFKANAQTVYFESTSPNVSLIDKAEIQSVTLVIADVEMGDSLFAFIPFNEPIDKEYIIEYEKNEYLNFYSEDLNNFISEGDSGFFLRIKPFDKRFIYYGIDLIFIGESSVRCRIKVKQYSVYLNYDNLNRIKDDTIMLDNSFNSTVSFYSNSNYSQLKVFYEKNDTFCLKRNTLYRYGETIYYTFDHEGLYKLEFQNDSTYAEIFVKHIMVPNSMETSLE